MNWIHSLNVISGQWADVMWRAIWQGTLLIAVASGMSKLAFKVVRLRKCPSNRAPASAKERPLRYP